MQVNMLEAKNQLSKLVKAALDGEDVIIANHGKPVVRLVKLAAQSRTGGYGAWKGLMDMSDDWDSPQTNAAIAKTIVESPLLPKPRRGSAKATQKPNAQVQHPQPSASKPSRAR